MKNFLVRKSVFALLLCCCSSLALADSWNLPQKLSDKNTTIDFEVDTTWHLVEGKTKGLQGEVSLSDPKDPNSITATLTLPVNKFDTDNSDRDEEMRAAMAEDKFPAVTLKIDRAKEICTTEVAQQKGCKALLEGSLSIRGVTRSLTLPVKINYKANKYIIAGTFTFPWASFGVEDPSIFVAKVYPDVTIKFKLKL